MRKNFIRARKDPGGHLICSHLQAPSTPALSFPNTNHHSNQVRFPHANGNFIIDFPVSSPVSMQTWVSQNCVDPSVSLHSSLAYTRVRIRVRENPKTELHGRWLQNNCIVDPSLLPHRTPPVPAHSDISDRELDTGCQNTSSDTLSRLFP